MVQADGYLKMIDMGTAKILEKGIERTFTIVGSPHYLAPEILESEGYSFLADIHSLGKALWFINIARRFIFRVSVWVSAIRRGA